MVPSETPSVKLTQYSHGAGCGCKIAPKILDRILHNRTTSPSDKSGDSATGQPHYANLLVGNDEGAAALEIAVCRDWVSERETVSEAAPSLVPGEQVFGRVVSRGPPAMSGYLFEIGIWRGRNGYGLT